MEHSSKSLSILGMVFVAACSGTDTPAPQESDAPVNVLPPDSGDGSGLNSGGASGGSAGAGAAGAGMAGTGASAGSGGAGTGAAGAAGMGMAGMAGMDAGEPDTDCSGTFVDLNSDPLNCGACGYAVVNGRECIDGRPTPAWQPISTVGAQPRTRHAASFIDGKFVASGGATIYYGAATTTVGQYSPDTDTWTQGAPLNIARIGHNSVATPDGVYIFGGWSDNSMTLAPGLETYNPSDSAWRPVADMTGTPTPRSVFAMAWIPMIEGIFIFGGRDNSGATLLSGAIFHPDTAAWEDASCSAPNCGRFGYLTAFENGSDIVVMGGPVGPAPYVSGLKYTPSTMKWSDWPLPAITPDPTPPRHADDGRRIFYLTSAGDCPGMVSVMIYTRDGAWSADTAAVPPGLVAEAAVAWSGSELIAWSGACGTNGFVDPVSVGGRYQPPAP